MGEHTDRLDRLRDNRSSFWSESVRLEQAKSVGKAAAAVSVVANDVRRAANIAGFEGGQGLGDQIAQKLLSIHSRLADFTEYQRKLGSLITQAHAELENTANGVDGLPGTGLTSEQQSTINIASQTDSPVQVRPGVTMSSAEAKQYYLDQAAAAQEEQARQMTAALDARLQEIIDSMPATDYDEPEPTDDPSGNDGPGNTPTVNYPGINGGGDGGYDGPGIIGNNDGGGNDGTNNNDNNNGGNDGDDTDPPRVVEPPRVYPPVYPPVDPPVYPPGPNDPTYPDGNSGDDTPRIDGDIGGVTGGGGGTGFPGGVTGTVGGGAGGIGAGVGGSLGAAGVVGGAAGLAGRLGGGGLLGGVGGVGGLGGAGGVGGVGGAGAGAGGVVAQSGAANGGRGGMVGGAAAGGGAAGGSDKRSRRRGQDLLAFEVEPDDDQIAPDLGAAGSAGRSASDGREELGW